MPKQTFFQAKHVKHGHICDSDDVYVHGRSFGSCAGVGNKSRKARKAHPGQTAKSNQSQFTAALKDRHMSKNAYFAPRNLPFLAVTVCCCWARARGVMMMSLSTYVAASRWHHQGLTVLEIVANLSQNRPNVTATLSTATERAGASRAGCFQPV